MLCCSRIFFAVCCKLHGELSNSSFQHSDVIVVFLSFRFFTPLFEYTPNAILSSIIISAVIGLIDFEAAICWCCFASVEIGFLITVSIYFCENSSSTHKAKNNYFGKGSYDQCLYIQ